MVLYNREGESHMIKNVLTYIFMFNISLPNVWVITTACACWYHKRLIAGLLTMLVGGLMVAVIEVLLGI
ncbi:MAG: hypothetical protein ACJAX4_004312 [Clostridium sp.]|jgi:hypothetical protein